MDNLRDIVAKYRGSTPAKTETSLPVPTGKGASSSGKTTARPTVRPSPPVDRRGPSTAAEAVKTGVKKEDAVSRYTGLEKGPGSALDQDRILGDWVARGCKFPSGAVLDRMTDTVRQSGHLIYPTNPGKLQRIREMRAYFVTMGGTRWLYLTDDHLIALSRQQGKARQTYEIICSAFGAHRRAQNDKRPPALPEVEGESDEVKGLKAALREVMEDEKVLQSSWQRKLEALKAQESALLSALAGCQARKSDLRAQLDGGSAATVANELAIRPPSAAVASVSRTPGSSAVEDVPEEEAFRDPDPSSEFVFDDD